MSGTCDGAAAVLFPRAPVAPSSNVGAPPRCGRSPEFVRPSNRSVWLLHLNDRAFAVADQVET